MPLVLFYFLVHTLISVQMLLGFFVNEWFHNAADCRHFAMHFSPVFYLLQYLFFTRAFMCVTVLLVKLSELCVYHIHMLVLGLIV